MKTVSIIISNRNYAGFLRQAIDSVLAQDWPAKELIVVDTGSVDASRDVILSYGTKLTPVFLENAGQGQGANAGYAKATGDILFFLDSDDLMLPGALSAVAGAFGSGVSRVSYDMRIIDDNGLATGPIWPEAREPQGIAPLDHYRASGAICAPPQSGNAYARHVLDTLMPLDMPYTHLGASHADGYFIVMCWLYGRSVHLAATLGCYRVHGRNHSGEGTRTNVAALREEMLFAEDWDRRLKARAKALGIPFGPGEGLPRSVRYQKLRLYSLRLDKARHPHADDTPLACLKDGLAAVRADRSAAPAARLKTALYFLVFAGLPHGLVERLGPDLFSGESRRALARRLKARIIPERTQAAL